MFIQEQTRSSPTESGNRYGLGRDDLTSEKRSEDKVITDDFIQEIVESLVIQRRYRATSATKETQDTVERVEQSYFAPRKAFAKEVIPRSSGDDTLLPLFGPRQDLLLWTRLCRVTQ